MVIVYASKTGFTKRYAEMLAEKTQLKAYSISELSKVSKNEEVIFLGWMKVGKVQGLNKMSNHNVKAVCGSGTGRTAEPDETTVISRNNLQNMPFFYMRGGCKPIHELKGFDRFMMKMFVNMLKKQDNKDESQLEAIAIVENGFDGVKEENLLPLINWIKQKGNA